MATKQPGTRKPKQPMTLTPVLKRWLARGAIAAVAGLVIGGAGGVMTVRTLEPGRANAIDSVQAVLDSIARGTIPEPAVQESQRAAEPQIDSAAVLKASQDRADSAQPTDLMVRVPDVVGLQEGPAREKLLDAGLVTGTVAFRASSSPAGTVLATNPAVSSMITTSSAVTLVISDGRNPADTLSTLPLHPAP